MIQLNLLPDVKKEFLRAQSARRRTIAIAILVTIIAAGLTALTAIYVYAVQNVIIYAQTQDIKNKAAELSEVKDIDKYLTVQNQLANLSKLHGDKHNYSRLLDFLPRLNPAPPKNITLTSLEVATEGSFLTFKGKVSDYGSLTTFKDTLENAQYTYMVDNTPTDAADLFKKVTIDAATYEKSEAVAGVSFTVIAEFDPAVFLQSNSGVTVIVPNKETTGSVVGTPSAIFEGAN